MTTAEYSINASPFSDRGFDAAENDVLTLALPSPGLDVESVVFSVVTLSTYAPSSPVFSPVSGQAATPSSSVTLNVGTATVAGRAYAFRVRCRINGGTRNGVVMPEYTKDRIVVIRNSAGLRPMLQGETVEYDPVFGWGSVIEEIIAVAAVAASIAPYTSAPAANGTADDGSSPLYSKGDHVHPRDLVTAETTHSSNGTLVASSLNVLGASVTAMTLPAASTWRGQGLMVKKNGCTGDVTISRGGSDTIDGATTYLMAAAESLYSTASFVAAASGNIVYPSPTKV